MNMDFDQILLWQSQYKTQNLYAKEYEKTLKKKSGTYQREKFEKI